MAKTFRLLEAVAANPGCSLTQLSRSLELAKPTTHRVLGELRTLGYIQRNAEGGYIPAPAIWRLLPGAHGRLLAAAEPVMRKLWKRTRETINLGVLRGQKVQYLQVLNSDLPLRRDVTAGELDPALTTALGRVMISQLDSNEQAGYLEQLPQRATPHTLTTKKGIEAAIQAAAREGYAVDSEETDLGVMCIATPIPIENGGHAALSISLPCARLDLRGGVEGLSQILFKATAAISRRLEQREPLTQPKSVKE